MHFSIIYKNLFWMPNLKVYENFTFEGFHIIIIQKFNIPKMCTKVHNDSNIDNTSFEDLENVQYQLEQ